MTTEREELVARAQDALDNAQGLTADDLNVLQEAVDAFRESQSVADSIRVDIEGVGICDIPVRDGVAYMPAITVADIVRRAQPASVDLLQIEAWLRTQRNNIPATGEEFADALRYCFITNANPTVPVDAAVKRDARRYRYIIQFSTVQTAVETLLGKDTLFGPEFDDAIDAALAAQQQESEGAMRAANSRETASPEANAATEALLRELKQEESKS